MRSHLTALRRRLAALRRRVGHRGAFLLGLSALDTASAYRLAWPEPASLHTPSYVFLASLAPLWVWAAIWAAVAVLTASQAFSAHDALAYGAAMVLKVVWASIYLYGWLVHDLANGYFSVAIWVFAAWMVYIVATWPEPTHEAEVRG